MFNLSDVCVQKHKRSLLQVLGTMSFFNAVLYLLESGQTWILKTGSRTGRQEFEWSSRLHTLFQLIL
jgi:hypothetical protein